MTLQSFTDLILISRPSPTNPFKLHVIRRGGLIAKLPSAITPQDPLCQRHSAMRHQNTEAAMPKGGLKPLGFGDILGLLHRQVGVGIHKLMPSSYRRRSCLPYAQAAEGLSKLRGKIPLITPCRPQQTASMQVKLHG